MKSLPRFSVENPVLVNLVMFWLIVGGIWSAMTIVREMFPESRPDRVLISTPYPGASPSEVEKGITLRLEETIKDVEHVEEVLSTAAEGASNIIVEMESDYNDIDQAVTDVKAAVDTVPVDELPEDALETTVTKLEPKWPVISVALYGTVSERELKRMGEDLREELLSVPGITNVVLAGTRRDEISVEVRPEKLVQYGLSFMDVAAAIDTGSLDLPGGQLRTPGANVSVRTLGERDRASELRDLVVRSDAAGRFIRLSDVATVLDGFEDVDVMGRFNGAPAVNVTVYKTTSQDAIEIASRVKAMVAGKRGEPLTRGAFEAWWAGFAVEAGIAENDVLADIHAEAARRPFPAGVGIDVHTDLSRFVQGRLELLTRNGVWGLVLVSLSLLVFLHWRVAFWVMMGLLLAIMGSLICLKALGYSLNLISMFGLIIVLGLLVDDAIIVSEHVYSKVEGGEEPKRAAVIGSEEVTWPVTCAILTTIVAFFPLMFIEGQLGDWLGQLPVIVCIALVVSLVEALTILPSHLAHGLRPMGSASASHGGVRGFVEGIRHVQNAYLLDPVRRVYGRFLRVTTRFRYVTMAALVAVFMVVLGLYQGGFIEFMFIQKIDSETVRVRLQMPVGMPVEDTLDRVRRIEREVLALPELRSVYTLVGAELSDDGNLSVPQSHVAQLFIELLDSEQRDRASDEIILELRSKTADLPGVEKLSFTELQGGPGGAPIHVEISGPQVEAIVAAARDMKAQLADYEGVFDIVDDFDAGKREVQLELYPSARALGLTTESLATQIRAAFYGFEARKVQRGREDVRIMVRYPASARRRVYDIETMRVAVPHGASVPLLEVARLTETTGFSAIRRKDQSRTVTVTADVDTDLTNSNEVLDSLQRWFPALKDKYPKVSMEFGGQKLETQKAFGSLKSSMVIALVLIYVILAGLFKSYVQPAIVMAVVPFGMIGVALGHLLLGYPLTILSNIGAVALTGIVVNDSMIVVTFINRRIDGGADPFEAVIEGGISRLRPILLTSATTVLGVAPLLLEQSFQAKFLIPMGISITMGLVFATVLTLVAVPALYLIVRDVKRIVSGVLAAGPVETAAS